MLGSLRVACGAKVAGGIGSPPRPGSSTMTAVTALAEQWDAILSEQPGDWSQLRLELRLADGIDTERACVVARAAQPVAPRRRLPHRHPALPGRVALRLRLLPGLVRTRLGQLDGEDIGGCAQPARRRRRRRARRHARPRVGAPAALACDQWRRFSASAATRSTSAAAAWSGAPAPRATTTASPFALTAHGGSHLLHVTGWLPGQQPGDLSCSELLLDVPGPDAALDGRIFAMALVRFGRVGERRAVISLDGEIEGIEADSDARTTVAADIVCARRARARARVLRRLRHARSPPPAPSATSSPAAAS